MLAGVQVLESLVGREKERSVAAEQLHRALSGQATPLLITGEAGYGKSSLVDQIARDATSQGFSSFVVRADEADSGVPYAALCTALMSRASGDGSDRMRELVTLLDGSSLDARATDGAPRARIVELLRRVIAEWAFREPVLFAFDDLHAADPGSVAAVLFLMRHLRRDRVCLVVTTRFGSHDLSPATADALARFHAGGSIELVELEGFDHDDVAAIVTARFGGTPDASLVEALEERTAGNPFFVVELVNALATTSAVSVDNGRIRAAADLLPTMPRSVSTAVLHRVFQLGPAARAAASVGSVMGHWDVSALSLIAQLAQLEDAPAEEACDVLVHARVLVETDTGFRFAHPLVRDALYYDLGPGERARLHWSVARHLVAERARGANASVVEIADHARRAHPDASSASVELFVEAGDALMFEQPRASVEWFDHALSASSPAGSGRAAIVLKRCHALDLSGRHAEAALGALELVGVVPIGPQKHDAVLLAARALTGCDRLDDAATLLEAELEEPTHRSTRLLLEAGFVALWRQDLEGAGRWLQEAEQSDPSEDRALADLLRARLDLDLGRHREGFERARDLAARLGEMPQPMRRSTALGLFASAAIHGDPRWAYEHDGPVAATDLAAVPALAEWHRSYRAWCDYRTGRWDDAIVNAEAAMATEDDPATHAAVVVARAVRTAVLAERGDHGDHRAHLGRSESEPMFGYLAAWSVALDALLAGGPQSAVYILRALAESPAVPLAANARSVVLSLLAEAAWSAGDVELARTVNAELQGLPRDSAGVAMSVRSLLTQALVEADAEAAEQARAVALEHTLALDAACALVHLGVIRRDADALVVAHDELGSIGAVVRQRVVTHELRKLGRRAPRQRRGGVLTAVEVEIAQLVAEGMSNRQVAERALLSPKTVEVYLSRIYAKTSCRSRVELAVLVNSGRLPLGCANSGDLPTT